MSTTVLVVVDDLPLNKVLADVLDRASCTAYYCMDAEEAGRIYVRRKPELVLLELRILLRNGPSLLSFFRNHHESRIILVSSSGDRNLQRATRENGADGFLPKLFRAEDLLLELDAVQFSEREQNRIFHVGDVSFNTLNHQLTCKTQTIVLQSGQIQFLKLLYDAYLEDRHVGKREINEWLQTETSVVGHLQAVVARLRKNLTHVGSHEVIIETLPRKGYRLICISD